MYSEPSQTSKINFFFGEQNKWLKAVTYFHVSAKLDVWQSSEYISVLSYYYTTLQNI